MPENLASEFVWIGIAVLVFLFAFLIEGLKIFQGELFLANMFHVTEDTVVLLMKLASGGAILVALIVAVLGILL